MVAIIAGTPRQMETRMTRSRRRKRVHLLIRRALRATKLRRSALARGAVTTLQQLKNSGRPLLFSRLPRMLNDDGRMAAALQNEFRYMENDAAEPERTVSRRRWRMALTMSRFISRRRRRL